MGAAAELEEEDSIDKVVGDAEQYAALTLLVLPSCGIRGPGPLNFIQLSLLYTMAEELNAPVQSTFRMPGFQSGHARL